MKKYKLLSILLSIGILQFGCSKMKDFDTTGFQNEAVIIGYYELEDCKGGYALNIVNDDRYNKLLFSIELPNDTGINPGSIFPIKVAIDWEDYDQYCPNGGYIKITNLKKL